MASNWTEQEDIIALFLYTLLPSGKWDKDNPTIGEYASLLGRTPSAVIFKLGNLRSLDNSHTSKGFSNISKVDRMVWNQFMNKPYELVVAYDESVRAFVGDSFSAADSGIVLPFQGLDTHPEQNYTEQDSYGWTTIRKGQRAFRLALLSNYNYQCCLSSIRNTDMLLASHIVPWRKDENNRTNPQNGLLLNALLDRAFDKGYFTLSPSGYETIVSEKIKDPTLVRYLAQFKSKKICLPNNPERWPKKEFLEFHNDTVFETFMDNKRFSFLE